MSLGFKTAILLVVCGALIGCGGAETSSEDGSILLSGPTDFVTELPNRDGLSLYRGIERFYESGSGEWIGLERASDLSRDKASQSYAFIRSGVDGFKKSYGPVIKDAAVSDLFRLNANSFMIAGLTPSLKGDGTIGVASRLVNFSFENNKVDILKEESSVSTIDSAVWDKGFNASKNTQRQRRLHLREPYEKQFFMLSDGGTPVFLPNGKPRLFISFEVESGVHSLESNTFRSLQPLNFSNWDAYAIKVLPCKSSTGTTMVMAGTREAFLPVFPSLAKDGLKQEQIIAAFGYTAGGLIWLQQPERIISDGRFHIETCTYINETIYVGGALSPQGSGVTTATLFVQNKNYSRFVKLRLPRNSFVSALEVHPKSGEIIVGGSQNFTQAATGSVSFMTGFVATFTKDLGFQSLRNLQGPRTTRVLALAIEGEEEIESIKVGGATNAPSTHDTDSSSRSFVHVIQ